MEGTTSIPSIVLEYLSHHFHTGCVYSMNSVIFAFRNLYVVTTSEALCNKERDYGISTLPASQ